MPLDLKHNDMCAFPSDATFMCLYSFPLEVLTGMVHSLSLISISIDRKLIRSQGLNYLINMQVASSYTPLGTLSDAKSAKPTRIDRLSSICTQSSLLRQDTEKAER
jgi:hypothetical protein